MISLFGFLVSSGFDLVPSQFFFTPKKNQQIWNLEFKRIGISPFYFIKLNIRALSIELDALRCISTEGKNKKIQTPTKLEFGI
jgi:hypothetical protein